MKTHKFLAVVAVFGCYVFGSAGVLAAPAMISICPVGGVCSAPVLEPASSKSNAVAVDVTPRLPVVDPFGPSGSYCGRAAVYTDDMGITERTPCQGHQVAYTAQQPVFQPPIAAYCDGLDTPTCYPDQPGGWYTIPVFATDCPVGYAVTTTGSSGPYQYYSCIKS